MANFAQGMVPAAFRRGGVLYIPRGAALPANCVKCGTPAQTPWRKRFYWHSQWLYILILSPIIYVIVSLIVRKQMELNIPLCEAHHDFRKRNTLIGAIAMCASIPLGIAIGVLGPGDAAPAIGSLVGFVAFIAGAIFLSMAGNYMRPTLIDDHHGEFTGPCESFLQLLPPV